MNHPPIRISIAIVSSLILSTGPFAFAADSAAEPAAGSISPDNKWECRLVAAGEEQGSDMVFVIARRGSDERSIVLSEEASGTFAQHSEIMWAPDSKRFAFNYKPALRIHAVQFFQLKGDEWRELDSPDDDDAVTAPITRSMEAQRRKLKLPPKNAGRLIDVGCEVRRWIGPDTALLYAFSNETFEIKNELESVGDSCFVTLKFDSAGEWKVVRTRLLADQGVARLNQKEREELAKLENGSEEGD